MFRSPLLLVAFTILSAALAACGGSVEPVATSSCSKEVASGRLRVELSAELATATMVAAGRCGSFACVQLASGGCTAWEGNIYGTAECEVRVLPKDGSASLRAFASAATCGGSGAEIVFDDGAGDGPPPVTAVPRGAPVTEDDGRFHTGEARF